ncbi:hypothetical protein [[Kitasatospora] papulosa]|uniref:hypothetical protein n=1 Tax=[Kitasatospora] papulosa TaxID=1464011 RepID=UPI003633D530
MRNRTTTAAIAAGILLTLTGCSSSGEPEPKAAPATTAAREYTAADCRALLERNYEAGTNSDVSTHSECAHLPKDQYGELVGSVLGGHADDVLNDAALEAVWDNAWDETSAEQRQTVCDQLITDGTDVVGQKLADLVDEPTGDEDQMAEYFLDEKC